MACIDSVSMKQRLFKVHRNFKLVAGVNARLKKEAQRLRRTETSIVEQALEEWLNIKRPSA